MNAPGSEPFYEIARARLDVLLELEIRRLRARYQLSLDEQRGLYISDAQVDRLLGVSLEGSADEGAAPFLDTAERLAEEARNALDRSPRWSRLMREFGLTPFERDVVLLCLAPDLDKRYASIYAYLNDDVTRRFATRDLAVRLFTRNAAEVSQARGALAAEAALFSSGLIQLIGSANDGQSWLCAGMSLADSVAHFLEGVRALGGPRPPGLSTSWPQLDWLDAGTPAGVRDALRRVPLLRARSLVILEGSRGSGRSRAASALAAECGVPLIAIDAAIVRPGVGSLMELVRAALLQQRLHRAVVHLRGTEHMIGAESAHALDARQVIAALGASRGTVLISTTPETRWREVFANTRHACVAIAEPSTTERLRLWSELRGGSAELRQESLPLIAGRFGLSRGQILRASDAADDEWTLSGRNGTGPDEAALFQAARAESRDSLAALGALAVRTLTAASWNDLVFPETTMKQLRELTDAIRHRSVVYETWGMASRNSGARGIRALFSGSSGTGKTTSAALIAEVDLGVDLYTVDLSAVSSKYIGETEKHLDRIFAAASASSAILFFDEADALFGKRSEVRDAHDRYSNIEVAYLLQKVDRHDGVVVLATNLANNLDQGFSRRMHFTIEFPFPTESERERIWRSIFPDATPVADDVNFGFLAGQFAIAGGDIRNVALGAAFLAASENRPVSMRDLVRAMARQMTKQGRSPSIADFREFMPLLYDET